MKNKYLKIKILSGMLCVGLTFSGASLSFAATSDNASAQDEVVTSLNFKNSANKKAAKVHRAEMKATLQIVIKESVTSKIITQTEGDKVLEYVNVRSVKNRIDHKNNKKGKCDGPKGGLYNDLVTDGILTKEKSDVLREKMHVKVEEIRTLELKKSLNVLVVKKVLTVDQCKKVQEVIIAKNVQKKEIYKKMRGMSEKDREDYIKKMDGTKVSPMKVLIDNGTITKEQEIEIQKVLPHHNHGGHGHHSTK